MAIPPLFASRHIKRSNEQRCMLNNQVAERKSEGEENKLQLLCERSEQVLSHSWDWVTVGQGAG